MPVLGAAAGTGRFRIPRSFNRGHIEACQPTLALFDQGDVRGSFVGSFPLSNACDVKREAEVRACRFRITARLRLADIAQSTALSAPRAINDLASRDCHHALRARKLTQRHGEDVLLTGPRDLQACLAQ